MKPPIHPLFIIFAAIVQCATWDAAVFVQGWALSQLWLFWVAPLLGGAIGALVYRFITPGKGETEPGY